MNISIIFTNDSLSCLSNTRTIIYYNIRYILQLREEMFSIDSTVPFDIQIKYAYATEHELPQS